MNKKHIISVVIVMLIVVLVLVISRTIDKTTHKSKEEKKSIDKMQVANLKYKLNKLTPSDYNDEQRKRYSLYNDKVYCNVEIEYEKKDEYEKSQNGLEYIKNNEMIYIGDSILEEETKNINGNDWGYIHIRENRNKYSNSLKDTYYYSIIKNKKIYLITYSIDDETREVQETDPNNDCLKDYTDLINSLSFIKD